MATRNTLHRKAEAEVMYLNLFPARVKTPNGDIRRARFYLRDGEVAEVWVADKSRPKRTLVASVSDMDIGRSRGPHVITTSELGTWTITKDSGCGCGSPLKRFDPRTYKEEVPA